MNAVRLRMDWRPVAGLAPQDAGTWVERLIARVLLGAAVEAHNADVERAKRQSKSKR